MIQNKIQTFGTLATLAFVAGCGMWAVGPDYQEPEVTAPAATLQVPDAGLATTNRTATGEIQAAEASHDTRTLITTNTLDRWWGAFNDPVLSQLVTAAVSNNLSFRMAQQRLVQARWMLVGAKADWLPTLDAKGSFTRSRYGADTSSAGGSTFNRDLYHAGFDAAWEIDLFGGVERAVEAAVAGVEGSECQLADAWVSLTAEIGSQYISLRTVQERLRVARANLKLQSETYDILKSRLDSGIGDELAVNQAKYNVEQTRAAIPLILAQQESCMNALAILAGTMPGQLHALLLPLPDRDWLLPPQRVDAIPLDLMRGRPDVRAAERALAVQVAHVGVAVSQFYPKFFINGSLGLDSLTAQRFMRRNSIFETIGPSFSWPIFQGGNMLANLRVEEAKMEEAVCKYELALETAFAETRNAYSAYTQKCHRYESLKAAVKAATDAVNISQDLYKNGLADFNNVLDAQRSLLTLEEALTTCRGNITLDLITLYKALGGGVTL